jgi:hypothetical protein
MTGLGRTSKRVVEGAPPIPVTAPRAVLSE